VVSEENSVCQEKVRDKRGGGSESWTMQALIGIPTPVRGTLDRGFKREGGGNLKSSSSDGRVDFRDESFSGENPNGEAAIQ